LEKEKQWVELAAVNKFGRRTKNKGFNDLSNNFALLRFL
jgi:hypothetical protein